MLDRCVKILLAMAYAGSQLVGLPHAHGSDAANVPLNHNVWPHIHVPWMDQHENLDVVEHDVQHGCHSQESQHLRRRENPTSHSHGENAVYLPNDLVVSLPAKGVISACGVSVVGAVPDVNTIQKGPPELFRVVAIYPGEINPHQPLWLALRPTHLIALHPSNLRRVLGFDFFCACSFRS